MKLKVLLPIYMLFHHTFDFERLAVAILLCEDLPQATYCVKTYPILAWTYSGPGKYRSIPGSIPLY